MQKEELIGFVRKKVKLILKTGYVYRGTLITVSETSLTLKDIKLGEMVISLDEIKLVMENVEWKNE